MPRFEFHEVHSVVVRAKPPEIFTAIRSVTPAEMFLVGALFMLRALPHRLLGRGSGIRPAPGRPILEQALQGGFVMLAEAPGQEIVLGTVGAFWSLRGGPSVKLESAREFVDFTSPGYAKAAMNFSVTPMDMGRTCLRTETRILPTDTTARRRFARYWRIVHVGSALIRRMWLGAIKRRAEASAS
ncbi:MAG: hypothetical protein ACRDFA_02900 [bacterium]